MVKFGVFDKGREVCGGGKGFREEEDGEGEEILLEYSI